MNSNLVSASIGEQSSAVMANCLAAMNDEVLVCAARSGDSGAFVELYERHSKKVLPRIYRITKNREDAEDAFQDAVLRAFVNIRSFEGRSTFTSWLTRIAMNSALMLWRKRRAGAEISIQQICDESDNSRAWEPQDDAESPEASYARRESNALLRNAIQRLPCILRETLELQQVNEYSTSEVAAELGVSESAAKSRLMRARKVLRRRLSGTRPGTVRMPPSASRVSSSPMVSSTPGAAQAEGTQA